MKKFRLMFTAAAVFAVVGSALALGTGRTEGIYRCRANNVTGTCPSETTRYSIDDDGNNRKCNSGVDSDTNCNTTREVVADAR